jgi:large subunit ribosomal protein L13
MKTYTGRSQDVEKVWYVIDLEGVRVGRVADKVAAMLRGKHRPEYTPHEDMGDFIIAINADKVVFSGNKMRDKKYYHHTGYPGGIKDITAEKLMKRHPTAVFKSAVKGMLPKNSLGRQMFTKLKVYAGGEHPHAAQKPVPLEL